LNQDRRNHTKIFIYIISSRLKRHAGKVRKYIKQKNWGNPALNVENFGPLCDFYCAIKVFTKFVIGKKSGKPQSFQQSRFPLSHRAKIYY
jgi:hypothetical protein